MHASCMLIWDFLISFHLRQLEFYSIIVGTSVSVIVTEHYTVYKVYCL